MQDIPNMSYLLHGHLPPQLHNDHAESEEAICCLDVPQVVEEHSICPL